MPKARPASQQRKRRVRATKSAPFPVPIATVTGESASNRHWFYYTAVLQGDGVVVRHTGDMDFLYRMGFFGKGEMSRGQPEWSEHWHVVSLPQQKCKSSRWQSMLRARVTSRRRYMTHLKWHCVATGDQAALGKVQEDQQQVVEECSKEPALQSSRLEQGSLDNTSGVAKGVTDIEETVQAVDEEELPETSAVDISVVNSVKPKDWGEEEGDTEFWGTEPVSTSTVPDPSAASWESQDGGDEEFWGTGSLSAPVSDMCHSGDVAVAESSSSCNSGFRKTKNTLGLLSESDALGENRQLSDEISAAQDIKCAVGERMIMTSTVNKTDSAVEQSSIPFDSKKEAEEEHCTVFDLAASCDASEDTPSRHTTAEQLTAFCDNDVCLPSKETVEESAPPHEFTEIIEKTPDPHVEWSEFCEGNENASLSDSGTLFVVPDSDDEEQMTDGRVCRTKTKWRAVVKSDPYPIKESLHLSYEEAFFLSYGLGCLSVLDSKKTPMALESMWREFCRRQSSFIPHYVAYHHYRSKNWVPKTGLKFGCTFLLYKDGPPFFHGSYSVVVKFVDTDGKAIEGHGEQRQFSWTSLAGLKRITEHVGKELMFCYVVKPSDMSWEEMMSPKCITHFRIKEVVVSRWVSSQEREGKALEEMP